MKPAKLLSAIAVCLLIAVSLSACEKRAVRNGTAAADTGQLKLWAAVAERDQEGFAQWIDSAAESTGVCVELIQPTGNAASQLEVLLASGTYPDLMYGAWQREGLGWIDDGIAQNLWPFVEDGRMPSLKRALDERAQWKAQATNNDGSMTMFPMLYDDARIRYGSGYFIRRDWLAKAGADVPETIGEWQAVLSTIVSGDFNGNNQADEVAFSVLDGRLEQAFLPAFDIPYIGCYVRSDAATHAVLEPGFIEYLSTMRQWFVEGLINPNFMSTNEKEMASLAINNQMGAFYGQYSEVGEYTRWNTTMDWIAVPPPFDAHGQRNTCLPETARLTGEEGIMVTSGCLRIDEALRFCDYFYAAAAQQPLQKAISGIGILRYESFCNARDQKLNALAEQTEAYAEQARKYQLLTPELLTSQTQRKASENEDKINRLVKDRAYRIITGQQEISTLTQTVAEVKRMGLVELLDLYDKGKGAQ